MTPEAVKRAAALAVSRYGADRSRVTRACQSLVQAQAQGVSGDLLDMLVVQRLLTPVQADELRRDLNGSYPTAVPEESVPETRTPRKAKAPASPVIPPTRSGFYLLNVGGYRLLRRLGEGGMGSVYLAYQQAEARQVAIKVLAERLASNQDYISRFHREAKNGTRLNHPNIVHCIEAGTDEASGKHYLVMEYVDGPTVRSLLDRFGKLNIGDGVHITLDIARALEYVHALNFVHRDIKPDNILVTKTGVAKLVDLGLAKFIGGSSLITGRRQGFGTPYYMPCEQAIDATQADGRCDIYALGATLYHLITGEVPFPGETYIQVAEKKLAGGFTPASAINPEVPVELDRILAKMLARDPENRYQTASELIVDLERTRLDVPVLSFADIDLAMQDPVVQARMTACEATLPDLQPVKRGSDANGHSR